VLISLSAPSCRKYSGLAEAARYQLSALSFPNKRRDFSHFAQQNFFAKCKEVIDKESICSRTCTMMAAA
jgi:hypothetical protein